MAAEVSSSSLVRALSEHMEEQVHNSGNSDILITKDLLGNLSNSASTKELDLEFKTQKCSSPKSPLSDGNHSYKKKNPNSNIEDSMLQDLNFPPLMNLFDSTFMDLKLQSSTPSNYQSVCTLDKVKFALERAEKETLKKRSSSAKEPASIFAAACPVCLLYVIASKTNPRCPRCNSVVPSAMAAVKKPRIDLNASFKLTPFFEH